MSIHSAFTSYSFIASLYQQHTTCSADNKCRSGRFALVFVLKFLLVIPALKRSTLY